MTQHEHRLSVLREAAMIMHKWLVEHRKLADLCIEYRATNHTITEAILTQIPPEEYRRIAKERRRQANAGGEKRLTVRIWLRREARRCEGYGRRAKVRRQRYIKIAHGESRGMRGKWVSLAQYLWERDHGPVPARCIVVHADGDSLNDDPGNLVLRSRAEQAALAVRTCDRGKRAAKISRTKRENAAIASRLRQARQEAGPDELEWDIEREAI